MDMVNQDININYLRERLKQNHLPYTTNTEEWSNVQFIFNFNGLHPVVCIYINNIYIIYVQFITLWCNIIFADHV
jgi:hypothetical protein